MLANWSLTENSSALFVAVACFHFGITGSSAARTVRLRVRQQCSAITARGSQKAEFRVFTSLDLVRRWSSFR